jgi:hypothetical protein
MTLGGVPSGGPCAAARAEVDTRCGEADRLAQTAGAHQQRLRDAQRQLNELVAMRDGDARVRDRRYIVAAKDEAQDRYHQQMVDATSRAAAQGATLAWLRAIDRLNRQVATADRRADRVGREVGELERTLPRIELEADAARIAADTAQEACMQARRVLAACEEEAQRRLRPAAPQPVAPATALGNAGAAAQRAVPPGARPPAVISLVLRGDRDTLLRIGLRLAEETGVEAGRLQLLLLELREAVAAQALASHALRVPAEHPFWRQFSDDAARQLAASLAALGYRFDGTAGWLDGEAPTLRELSVALSNGGIDPRTIRRPADQQAIQDLWRGTAVLVEAHLAHSAPRLELEDVIRCLGERAGRLSELWDMWGRLRPLLLAPASA